VSNIHIIDFIPEIGEPEERGTK